MSHIRAGNDDLIQSRKAVNKNIKLNNRYSGLNDTVVISEDPDESAKEENLNDDDKQNEFKKKQRKGKKKQKSDDILHDEVNFEDKENLEENIPNEHQHNGTTSVVDAGDSIIKYVRGWELSNGETKCVSKVILGCHS